MSNNTLPTLTPIPTLPVLHETSQLISPRESNGVFALWRWINVLINRTNVLTQNTSQIVKSIKGLNSEPNVDYKLHPFAIYNLPDVFRTGDNQVDYDTNWRTVRVRGGYVLTTLVSTGSFVIGTDLQQAYPYQNYYPSTSSFSGSGTSSYSPYDVTIPVNTPEYWFWINTNSGSYTLSHGATPATPVSGGAWSNYPSASTTNIPIGYVDTNISASINLAYVRQFLTTDVLASGGSSTTSSISTGMNPRGIWQSGTTYNINDFVQLGTAPAANWYVCTFAGNTNYPPSNIGWVSMPISAGTIYN
jgi:hypothetical protein